MAGPLSPGLDPGSLQNLEEGMAGSPSYVLPLAQRSSVKEWLLSASFSANGPSLVFLSSSLELLVTRVSTSS